MSAWFLEVAHEPHMYKCLDYNYTLMCQSIVNILSQIPSLWNTAQIEQIEVMTANVNAFRITVVQIIYFLLCNAEEVSSTLSTT